MPATSSYTFKILLEGKEALSEAKRIRAELEKELGQGLDFRQAQQQMGSVADLSRTTGANAAVIAGGLGQAAQEGDKLVFDMREADDATRQMVSDLFRSGASAQQLEQALRGGTQAVEDTRQQVRGLGSDYRSAMAQVRRETADLRAAAMAGGRIGRGMMTTGMAIIGPLTLAGKSYLQFADDANRAARQLKLNASLTDELKSETLDLSASLGLFKPEEINQALYTWASAIGAVAENQGDLDRLLGGSIEIQKLAAMNQEQLGTTTEHVAAILGEFNMDVSQTKRVVALLNYTADRTQATVSDLGESFKFLGPMAHALGEDIEDVASVLGVAADAGIKSSMAGRAVRQMYISLTKPTEEMNKAFNEALGLSGELGQSWQDIVFQGGKFVGTAATIDLLAAVTEDMTDQERMALLAHLATANELPVLTALVLDQIAARKEGINSLRAWKKQAEGTIDAEVRKYAEWREVTKGIKVSQEDMFESWAREWLMYEEEDTARADRMAMRWSAAWMRVGKAAVETALPMLEQVADALEDISHFVEKHPEMMDVAIKGGGALVAAGASIKGLATAVRLYADARMLLAATGAVGGLGASVALAAGALIAEKYVVEAAGVPDWMQEQMAQEMATYEEYVKASQEITRGRLELLTRAQWEAVHAGQELGDVLEETGDRGTRATDDIAEEMRSLKEHAREAKKETKALGDGLMQLPPATEQGLAAFSEAELQAIDEWESYLRRRNEMIEEQNQELLDLEADFLAEQAEQYQDYMSEREDLLKELAEVTEDPLWLATEEVQESLEQQREAYEEYNHDVEEAAEDLQRKLRGLQEDHDSRMLDLEASRDARGLIEEKRSYDQAVRDANEQNEDLLEDLEERLNETIEQETEAITKLRDERRADLEEQLKELDKQYEEEDRKRQAAYDKELDDLQQQQVKELTELEKAHAQRLASIMTWEERINQALRDSYAGREEDLRQHLFKMEQLYNTSMGQPEVTWTTLPFTGLPIPSSWVGLQAGGYAGAGMYQLGEAGREFVLSAPTTRAMERAMGHLTQTRMMGMAGGSVDRLELLADINVRADPAFGPGFAADIKADVRGEIVAMFKQVIATSHPGGYRPR